MLYYLPRIDSLRLEAVPLSHADVGDLVDLLGGDLHVWAFGQASRISESNAMKPFGHNRWLPK